jgi:anion-transporting  ArsA/GET3 family ATPase
MGAHVQLNVPPEAETARLLTRNRRWGVYYRSLVGDTEGRVEFRTIDSEMLSADDVDPADADAVVAHIEHRLDAAGFDTTRRDPEGAPVAATWDIRRRGAA